ncbi:MAG: hypothetical protein JNL41_07645 [Phenylobacterium sp.]|uniref:hypothetical protein n=1 Tax=Phenylobacterium sp. TaxID=1871053 RepID=UPI001A3A9034|nr:hypothetical protein [Phenylobacterium sp.]MBL8554135.1 hypothetical protein [Phenylobacterium sp.]
MTLLVVVHAETSGQVLRNVERALSAGADGVFLINHAIADDALVAAYRAARARFADAWIGLSFMRLSATSSLGLVPADASGLWVSDAGTHEVAPQPPAVTGFADARAAAGWGGLYFGGVAFKHQRPVSDPAAAARAAAPFVDVVTTSGSATGSAAPLDKVASMKAAIGPHPLALASGVSAENFELYRPHVDCVLAASSVSDSEAELSPTRLSELVAAMR